MDFLESVASYYLEHESSDDWSRIKFVFPSHRAGVFFRNSLRDRLGDRVIFGVNALTINDLFEQKAKLIVADRLTLIFELYAVYKDVFGSVEGVNTDFEFFFSWAQVFISDFSDVDKYMIDARQIFSNTFNYEELGDDYSHLSENQRKAIEQFWRVALEEKEDGSGEFYRKRFTTTYEHLYELYETFRNRLRLKGLAYDGMIYREVAESYSNLDFGDDDERYVFVGFNAVSTSERIVMKRLSDAGKAQFFWDYTPQMLERIDDDDDHGAGRFIRSLIVDFPMPKDYSLPKAAENQALVATAFAYQQGQIVGVADFLKRHYSDNSAERTAIVLADENMLLPVISALPTDVSRVNVTMGYPLRQTQLFGLIDLLARLQSPNSLSGTTFYGRYVLQILQHACVFSPESKDLVNDIVRKRSIRVAAADLQKNPLLTAIFQPIHIEQIASYERTIFELLYEKYAEENELLRECSFEVLKVVNRFDEFMKSSTVEITDIGLAFRIFIDLVKTQTVDFLGVPLAGLQVMGILETRALDFDNIVILDVNEGILPKDSSNKSFIPHVIRRSFGMPTYAFHDSMIAYYFFRLISRAKHVDFLYSTAGGDDKAKGQSRFILQMKYQYRLPLVQRTATHDIKSFEAKPRSIVKTPEMLDALVARFSGKNVLSPSTLTNYMTCPATLFYHKVLGLSDADDLVENIDGRIFGNIFHGTMEKLLTPTNGAKEFFLSKENKEALKKDSATISALLCMEFEKEFGGKISSKDDLDGQNYLFFDTLFDFVKKAIDAIPDDSTILERELHTCIPFSVSADIEINIGGIIDCVYKDPSGKICVLDYKTGKVEKEVFGPDSFEKVFSDPHKHKELIQTLLYCYILSRMDYADDFYPRILNLQRLYRDDFSMTISCDKLCSKEEIAAPTDGEMCYSVVKEGFEQRLFERIKGIFDLERPFEANYQAGDHGTCAYCDFKTLCTQSAIGQ